MNVTLNKNSWHFKLYESVVGSNPPKSLCPYFWTMVLVICVSPLILIFKLVSFIGDGFTKIKKKLVTEEVKPELSYDEWIQSREEEFEKLMIRREKWDKATDIFLIVLKWVMIPLLGLLFIYGLYEAGKTLGLIGILTAIGISLLIISIILGLVYLIEEHGHKAVGPIGRFLRWINPLNWEITQMIGGMIYATYKKACPLIEWEGDNETKTEESYGDI
jgi:amino acid transporter